VDRVQAVRSERRRFVIPTPAMFDPGRVSRDERSMQIVEFVLAGTALLAAVLLSLVR